MMKKILAIVLAVSLVLPCMSLAVSEAGLKTGIWQGISFMTGGVSKGERADMEDLSERYNLKVVMATTSGSYLALIPVTIYDDSGKRLLKVNANGPWFYADLPEGLYTVKAVYEGQKKEKKVHVDKGLQLVMFHWTV